MNILGKLPTTELYLFSSYLKLFKLCVRCVVCIYVCICMYVYVMCVCGVCVCVCVCVCVHVFRYLWRSEEDIGTLGAEVPGRCEQPHVDAGKSQVS